MDLNRIEYELAFMYNAVEVDIDAEGIFGTFLWDQYDEEKAWTIKHYLMSKGLHDVDHETDVGDGTVIVYGFFDEMSQDDQDSYPSPALESVDGEEVLDERKTVIKVNAKGKRRRKVMCGKGKKWDGTRCVMMSAGQKLKIKKGKIKARRTNKAKGFSKKRRTKVLRNKAMKRRSQQGLK